MKRVFVVQKQTRWNQKSGKLEPRVDVSLAEEFGEITVLLDGEPKPHEWRKVVASLHEQLRTFCDEDFLVLTGNPMFIGLVVAIAADYNGGVVTILQWSKQEQAYLQMKITGIYQMEDEA